MSTPFGSVEYRSVDRFEESYIKEIQDDAFQLIQDHIWWNNPVNLYDKIEYPLYLTGDSDLLLLRIQDLKTGFTRSIDFRDDLILGLVDYTKTLEILSILSRNHDITWKLFRTPTYKRRPSNSHLLRSPKPNSCYHTLYLNLQDPLEGVLDSFRKPQR